MRDFLRGGVGTTGENIRCPVILYALDLVLL